MVRMVIIIILLFFLQVRMVIILLFFLGHWDELKWWRLVFRILIVNNLCFTCITITITICHRLLISLYLTRFRSTTWPFLATIGTRLRLLCPSSQARSVVIMSTLQWSDF